MASIFDLKGTSLDTFKLGIGGPIFTRSGSNVKIGVNTIITDNVLTAALATKPETLATLTDINLTTVANGQVLSFNTTTGKWANSSIPLSVQDTSITSITYDLQNRVSTYVMGGANYSITYNSNTTVIIGNSKTRTLTYNGNGQLTSDVTV